MSAPWLGIVADDVTGACDVAGGLAELGMRVAIILGPPAGDLEAGFDCVVVGLANRSVDAAAAATESVAAARWLLGLGVGQLYQKYCSTFDSTDRGNIGPVADAMADVVGRGVSVGTPATPAAGRTQYGGILFVDGVPLAESPMREHPINPMTDSSVVRLLERQSTRPVELLRRGAALRAPSSARHILADAIDDDDLDAVAAAIAGSASPVLAGGGAGLAIALARSRTRGSVAAALLDEVPRNRAPRGGAPTGGRLILCGSGSARTREQVAHFSGAVVTLDPLAVAGDERGAVENVVSRIAALPGPVLVTTPNSPDEVRAVQSSIGIEAAAAIVGRALGAIAVAAVETHGIRSIVVAGGETSGAVARALGITRLAVRSLAAPGVPWTIGVRRDGTPIALLLKSGNFGAPDLFDTAWEASP